MKLAIINSLLSLGPVAPSDAPNTRTWLWLAFVIATGLNAVSVACRIMGKDKPYFEMTTDDWIELNNDSLIRVIRYVKIATGICCFLAFRVSSPLMSVVLPIYLALPFHNWPITVLVLSPIILIGLLIKPLSATAIILVGLGIGSSTAFAFWKATQLIERRGAKFWGMVESNNLAALREILAHRQRLR